MNGPGELARHRRMEPSEAKRTGGQKGRKKEEKGICFRKKKPLHDNNLEDWFHLSETKRTKEGKEEGETGQKTGKTDNTKKITNNFKNIYLCLYLTLNLIIKLQTCFTFYFILHFKIPKFYFRNCLLRLFP